jgi:hypothetical protein
MVVSRCTVIAFTSAMLVDVVIGISGPAIVDDAVTDRGRFVPPWRVLGMNRGPSLLSGGLRRLL